jgi:alpha-amylase
MRINGQPWPMRVILDVVVNHSGDNWSYPGGSRYRYSNDEQFPFGAFRRSDRPIPTDLRDPACYHRRGEIQNWDAFPEVLHGDIETLKDYYNEDDATGSFVVNALIKAHCYWIRVADVDGFRVDAVKHMGALACAWFTSNVREYAYSLGKRGFFLFGEVATASDDLYNGYIGPNTSARDSSGTVFFGLDSVLDFRLAGGIWGDDNNAPLRDVLKGRKGPQTLFNRLEAQRQRALNRGEIGRYLVTFVDNHDWFWQKPTGRYANGADDRQVIGAIGFLLCTLGTACIYYGTEQGFSGSGDDNPMREAMFDMASPGRNLLNTSSTIYREIASIAAVMRSNEPLRFGRIYYRQISGDGVSFGLPFGSTYTLAWSRLLYARETLVAYNVSASARSDFVIVDSTLHPPGSTLRYLYGGGGSVVVQSAPDGSAFVQLPLAGYGFAILA